jgi:signal transduction histidine kinase
MGGSGKVKLNFLSTQLRPSLSPATQPIGDLPLSGNEEEGRYFILLRYVLIIAAAYLLLFEGESTAPVMVITLIAGALASNILLSRVRENLLLRPFPVGLIICADIGWIAAGLWYKGGFGSDIFFLYFFVLFLAAIGEDLILIVVAAVLLSALDLTLFVIPGQDKSIWTSSSLIRVPFIFTAALFYGHLTEKVKRERRHALIEKGFAEKMAHVVQAQTKDLREQAEELRMNYEKALAANRLKAEFVATVSHELRTPLQAIMGYIEALLDGALGSMEGSQKRVLDRMRQNGLYLFDLIVSILNLNRLEAGRFPVRWEEIDVPGLLGEVDRMARHIPGAGDVVFEFHAAPGIPILVSDGDKLKIILRNLVGNAVKFTEKGLITARADFDSESQRIEFSVRDTGTGIDEEEMPFIFDMFWQKDKTHTNPRVGIGLGLYIVKQLVNDIMGEVNVESKKGEGSLFRVRVPINPRFGDKGKLQ